MIVLGTHSGNLPLACEERVDLAEGFDHSLLHPHLDHLFHRLAAGEAGLDRHRRGAVGLGDRHRRDRRRHLRVRPALLVGEAVLEAQPVGRLGLLDPPPAVVLLALRSGMKSVARPPGERSWSTKVAGWRRRPTPRSSRRGSDHISQTRSALASNSAVNIMVRASRFLFTSVTGIGCLLCRSSRISSIRSTRPRQTVSRRSSAAWARSRASVSARTIDSRPTRCLLTSSARSSTATCFCTAARLIGYSRPRAETESRPSWARRKMSRRVGSSSPRTAGQRPSRRRGSVSYLQPLGCKLARGWRGCQPPSSKRSSRSP